MAENFDVIVIGLGGFGSSTLYELAKRGVRALGIEQFGVAHDRGSSHGETRIIRKAYFEHPDYVPLLNHTYDMWRELESESGNELMNLAGLVLSGCASGVSQPAIAALAVASVDERDMGIANGMNQQVTWVGTSPASRP